MPDVSRRTPSRVLRRAYTITLVVAALLITACTSPPRKPARSYDEVHAEVLHVLPARAPNREAWAAAVADAFLALDIEPSTPHVCAALAVAEQESNFVADPQVPGLGRIARTEIARRAESHHVPQFLVDAALAIRSGNGRSYAERIAGARTERELSLVYEDLIARVPLGQQLFADANPVKTAGPMQVSVAFAEQYARAHRYPYARVESEPLRNEVFTLRGGVYFGIAHLLAKPVSYDRMIYRFADYNAGFYASRNAAFQNAVAIASGKPLTLDGDLVDYTGGVGRTELALRTLAAKLDMSPAQIHRALELSQSLEFETTDLYERVYALADKHTSTPLPRAMIPQIDLSSPKISRKLTTQWFAERVQQRYRGCLARSS